MNFLKFHENGIDSFLTDCSLKFCHCMWLRMDVSVEIS